MLTVMLLVTTSAVGKVSVDIIGNVVVENIEKTQTIPWSGLVCEPAKKCLLINIPL